MVGPLASTGEVLALLGPTNTGKTHQAIEALLEHRSGMIGLPLRLLAREVYDKLTVRVGESAVALVTGEEKRVPARPRYWVCTVESMPMQRDVDFVVVDEIQLCADRQRGHVFTHRLLHARGRLGTWFLGAATMAEIIGELVPTARIQFLTRLSDLRHAGRTSVGALPARSAVVAFSAPQVYELAERVRQKKGGAAVVLGALSPRTRNAQVALYQSGEVQTMVATDAIGMGLNMDVDHVAFAARRKFDGRELRDLAPHELAQIAGRAGRHQSDGTFGSLDPLPPFAPGLADAIEQHRFAPVRKVIWRNADLDFGSLDGLIHSLQTRPRSTRLRLVERADDTDALRELAQMPEVRARARSPEQLELLWSVCQIPDFRKLLLDDHAHLLAQIHLQLTGPKGRIDADWMGQRIDRLDDIDGEIDMLMTRIAWVRTWTYVASHERWLDEPAHWQGRTRAIEDRLSDALHERLTRRFVERTANVGWRGRGGTRRAATRRGAGDGPAPAHDPAHPFARLAELSVPQTATDPAEDSADIELGSDAWWSELTEAPHEAFDVDAHGRVRHVGTDIEVACWRRGVDLLSPQTALLVPEDLGGGIEHQLSRRLSAWTRDAVAELLAPLREPLPTQPSAAVRGILYALERGLGSVRTREVRGNLRRLGRGGRSELERMGVRLGELFVYVREMLSPRWVERRAALWRAYTGHAIAMEPLWEGSAVSIAVDRDAPRDLYEQVGFPVFGGRALRADLAERAHRRLRDVGPEPQPIPPELSTWLGCPANELPRIVQSLGFRRVGRDRYRRR